MSDQIDNSISCKDNHDLPREVSEGLDLLPCPEQTAAKQKIDELFQNLFSLDDFSIKVDDIHNLRSAHDVVSSTDDQQVLNKVLEKIYTNKLVGYADDYHNLSVEYSRKGRPVDAAEICRIGIQNWPDKIDLYADRITYAKDACDRVTATTAAKEMLQHFNDKSLWNWRAFTFLFDYYMAYQPKGYRQKAKALVEDYKKYLPFEEKANMSEAEYYESVGQYEGVKETLESAIKSKNAPQCALKLADFYFERGNYANALRVATKGIAFSAEAQPSIRTAYLLLLRALSKDAMFLSSDNPTVEEAKQIIAEYQLAKRYVSGREQAIADMRISILETYSGINDQ